MSLAKERLPDYASNLFVGNALTWRPPQPFDHVRTELCYVPEVYQPPYVSRLLEEFLAPGGRLLVVEYRSRRDPSAGPWVNEVLEGLGFGVASCVSGFWEGQELTRVAVVHRE